MANEPGILCVSLNPAVDRRIVVPQLRVGEVNRARSADPAAGGKAAHVALAAASLGAPVRWLGFLGGAERASYTAALHRRGITPIDVEIAGRTRNTLEIIDETTGVVTEVLEPGPVIREEEREQFLRVFAEQVRGTRVVAMSGSLPGGLAKDFYAQLVRAAKASQAAVLLDTSGEALDAALGAAPDVIKPNRQEASALLRREVRSLSEAADAARALGHRGPKTVILSLGAEGAIVAEGETMLFAEAPKIAAKSTVGSGDSFLAGWAVATTRELPNVDRLRLAIACGSANCVAESPGILDAPLVDRLSGEVQVRELPTNE